MSSGAGSQVIHNGPRMRVVLEKHEIIAQVSGIENQISGIENNAVCETSVRLQACVFILSRGVHVMIGNGVKL